MKEGIGPDVLTLAMIRRFIRLGTAYYIAYRDQKDVIQAEQWIKKHRSYRSHSEKMDEQLEHLYFPNGDLLDDIDIDNDDDDHHWTSIVEELYLAEEAIYKLK